MDSRVITVVAAVVGIPIILVGYLLLTERFVSVLPRRVQPRVRPYLWIFPAVAFATVFMVIPTINTIILSFQDRRSEEFVGLANYQYFFTNPGTTGALKNSLLWLVFFTGGVVIGGLLIAVLFDRVRYESLAKLAVFLPLPISAVAASIIWKFMFEYQPEGQVRRAR
jgi:alpha-glucoside transport system permease protein